MNGRNPKKSWIHIESFSESHSWKQTWMFLGGAAAVFAFALLYEIDKDMRCNPAEAAIKTVSTAAEQTAHRPELITLQADR